MIAEKIHQTEIQNKSIEMDASVLFSSLFLIVEIVIRELVADNCRAKDVVRVHEYCFHLVSINVFDSSRKLRERFFCRLKVGQDRGIDDIL